MRDVLYHYCSTEAFESIVRHGTIRLSSLVLSNDTMEGKWLRKVIGDLCDLTPAVRFRRDEVSSYIDIFVNNMDGLGFCLSKHEDMLSQWRGYANDARGFCIGFDKDVLRKTGEKVDSEGMPIFRLRKVEYDLRRQTEMLRPMFDDIVPAVEKGYLRPVLQNLIETDEEYEKRSKEHREGSRGVFLKMLLMTSPMFEMKNPAFREEGEFRLVTPVMHELDQPDVDFRPAVDRLVPFRTAALDKDDNPIVSVTIGPKNISSKDVVGSFLRRMGYRDVAVKQSEATYR
ncbi:DUF2971 domain-containing protein [Neorhizobium sp. T25_13]|uniref:DUF2971 domain-containing protein n=1 Tax=Neorhizobium sp. T25_13 TaxID=2093830 RepID=UPI00155DDEDB|nr:DUF2971 domain-containing protein [Neorhizobium sp. T25_13]